MSSAESHLSLLDSVIGSAKRLCAGELCCLGHRREVSTLCLLYEIYHRAGHPMHGYQHHFFAARNTRAPAALCELVLVIPRCRTDQFIQLFLLVAGHLWNLLLSDVFSDGTLSSLRVLCTYAYRGLSFTFSQSLFRSLLLFYSLPGIMVLGQFCFIGDVPFPSFTFQVILLLIIICCHE